MYKIVNLKIKSYKQKKKTCQFEIVKINLKNK